MFEVKEVGLAHPAREAGKIDLGIGYPLDRIDTHPFLPGVTPFLSNDGGFDNGGRDDKHHELHYVESLGDLCPPASARL